MLGQSMVEFLIVLPSLLLIVFGILQFALIYQARIALNHAAFVGARQGALSGGDMKSILDGVASGLTPLFMRMSVSEDPAIPHIVRARLISTIEIFNPNTAMVEILNPTAEAFNALNVNGVIPNDNLMYRTDSGGGVSIQDANLLKIKVTYCFKLVVPFVNQLIYGLNAGLTSVKNLTGVSFDLTSRTETRPNLCSNINKTYAQAMEYVDSLNSKAGPMAPLAEKLTDPLKNIITNSFNVIPSLNWNLGGIRIPISAESTVRMQTPFAASAG
jgi:hypothetical protein